jgi:hypothetical protein
MQEKTLKKNKKKRKNLFSVGNLRSEEYLGRSSSLGR